MSVSTLRGFCVRWALGSLISVVLCFSFQLVPSALAQSELATVFGRVTDQSGAVVPEAEVEIKNVETGLSVVRATNSDGLYSIPSLHPGHYLISIRKPGFKTVTLTELTLNVQDNVVRNFQLQVGSISESITVTADSATVNTTDATVSTVVDRQFAENLPMNGRSFQSLIDLTPGVVITASNTGDNGQFSINGQRAASNYWMVDGVSANIGIGVNSGNGLGGAGGAFSALGGTNSLVSVDAMQEFRIQTSTYAPEFGRTPGGQISILTRSGTNQFHGTAFDYIRNDALDANYWFNTNVAPALPKSKERQNDFGGTLGGPILNDRTFFFFSYEGLRLRLPQTTYTYVPDLAARQNAIPAMQPFLNAFPLPNPNKPDVGPGIAPFDATLSDPATLDAYSLRIDHKLTNKWFLFGRYNYSPSEIMSRGGTANSLSTVSTTKITTQTATLGATWLISPTLTDDLRFNYSRTNALGSSTLDNFGGATPLTSLPLPSPFTPQNSQFTLNISSLLPGGSLVAGPSVQNIQRQINVVDTFSMQKGSHSLKFGVDFRRLSPLFHPTSYFQDAIFGDVPSAQNGTLAYSIVISSTSPTFLFRNLGLYAQDTWRILPRLTLTYGLRWDVDFVPESISGPNFPAVTGFNLNNLSNLALAPAGTPPYKTAYSNLAPRLGVAYQLSQSQDWQTVIRGGFGLFYDLATSEMGNVALAATYPFFGFGLNVGGTFPLSPEMAAPPLIAPPNASNSEILAAFDPHLQLPYTLQWNAALEQTLGKEQTVSASYIGAAGRRLLQTATQYSPNPNLYEAELVTNAGKSDYDALQIQFQRRLSRGLQVLASYTWSHSIDTASAGSAVLASNQLVPSAISANRGPSDFDIRNAFSAGVTYDIPAPKRSAFARAILGGWSTENFVLARTAPPVDVEAASFNQLTNFVGDVRPDLVPGEPLYLYGSQFPGGMAFNPAAFVNPPVDPNTGLPLRQGNVPRNFLKGFGATQWDFAIHRNFPIHESLKLQFRAEMFNLLNHPNFGSPNNGFGSSGFGVSTEMLGQYLTGPGSVGSGGFSPLYQIGGPRSIQLALKLQF